METIWEGEFELVVPHPFIPCALELLDSESIAILPRFLMGWSHGLRLRIRTSLGRHFWMAGWFRCATLSGPGKIFLAADNVCIHRLENQSKTFASQSVIGVSGELVTHYRPWANGWMAKTFTSIGNANLSAMELSGSGWVITAKSRQSFLGQFGHLGTAVELASSVVL